MQSYTPALVEGTKSVKKDLLKKHLSSNVHLKAMDLNKKSQLGTTNYNKHVLQNTPIGNSSYRKACREKWLFQYFDKNGIRPASFLCQNTFPNLSARFFT